MNGIKLFFALVAVLTIGCQDGEDFYTEFIGDTAGEDDRHMTLDFSNDITLVGRREEASTDYQYGTYKDRDPDGAGGTVPGTGTPEIARIRKDLDGLRQAIIALGKVTPSGLPDTATSSQILQGLLNQYDGGFTFKSDVEAPLSADDFARTEINKSRFRSTSNDDASGYRFESEMGNGLVTMTRSAPTVSTMKYIWLEYDFNWSYSITNGMFALTTDFTLPDILAGKSVMAVSVEAGDSSGSVITCSFKTGDDGGLLQITEMTGPGLSGNPSGGGGKIRIMLDPL